MNLTPESDIIIESVPNFSEGRRPEVVAAIVQAIAVPGVLVLNYSSDWDHNRSVVTIAGPPAAVIEGLFHAIRVAAERIDLFQHQGVHPRLGATDVVPLIPLQNSSIEHCITFAHQLGERIGRELALPVYLYEAAAMRPERQNLADVRRGEFEQLVQEIELPARQPDYGPAKVGPAGAVIVGVRPFLIAYNVYLQSGDVTIAKRISKAIRASNGGFPAVKALGLLVNGQAQVSLNLVDYTQTPLPIVFAAIKALAATEGVAIDRSELIGLIPQAAVLQTAAHYLQLPELGAQQIVEGAIATARSGSMCA
ncbi:MAG: glutamate formimidoyltransferase [Caldilineaceae bacterium]|nr:glutamate formimidoyltransferase [Caldilineaceae bacterium]